MVYSIHKIKIVEKQSVKKVKVSMLWSIGT